MLPGRELPSRADLTIAIDQVRRTGESFILDTTNPHAPVFSLSEKFDRRKVGSEGWQPGERLRTKFIVDQPRSHHSGNRANSLGLLDGTDHGDLYTFEELSPGDRKALRSLGLAEIEATVEIEEPGVDSGHAPVVYKSKLISIEKIAKPFDGDISKLRRYTEDDKYKPETEKTLIQGEVVEYVENKDYPYEGAHMSIQIGGKIIDVALPGGKNTIYSGDPGIFNPSHPIPGDTIQFSMVFGGASPGVVPTLRDVSYLAAQSHLVGASPKRVEEYELQRRTVTEAIERISQTDDPKAIREIVATLMKDSYYQEEGHRDRVALTKSEKTALRDVIAQQIHDDKEKPLDFFDFLYDAERVRKAFDIDIYSMSKSDFYEFCMRVISSEVRKVDASVSVPLFDVVRHTLPVAWQFQVAEAAVNEFAPKVLNSISHLAKDGYEDDEGNRQAKYHLRDALHTLSYIPSSEGVEVFTSVVDGILEKKDQLLDKREMHDVVRDYVLMLSELISRVTQREENRIVAIGDSEVMKRIIPLLPKLHQVQSGIESNYTRGEVDRAIQDIQAAAAFLYLRDVIGVE